MTHSSRLLVGTLLALASSGCTVVADLDSYISADDIGCDMEMAVRDFSPHLTDLVFFQAVTRDDAQLLRAMAIIDPLGDADRSFIMPDAIGEGAHAFNFWADENGNGVVETSPFNGPDHSWRLEDVCNWASTCMGEDADLPNCFSHVAPFDAITDPAEPGNSLVLNLTGLPADTGFVEVHLIEVDAVAQVRRVVGLYRRDTPLQGTMDPEADPEGTRCAMDADSTLIECTLVLRGLAVPGRRYSADVVVDLDGNREINGTTEVFSITESDGSAYASPVVLDVSTFDPAGALPEEGVLVSPLPAP